MQGVAHLKRCISSGIYGPFSPFSPLVVPFPLDGLGILSGFLVFLGKQRTFFSRGLVILLENITRKDVLLSGNRSTAGLGGQSIGNVAARSGFVVTQ